MPKIPYFRTIIFIGIASIAFCYVVYPFETTADRLQFIATVVSLIVAFFAFIIALKTYFSIDSVYVISQMEGNVLENENYVTSFTSLLWDYKMEDKTRVGNTLFEKLEDKFENNSNTAREFAFNLQYFIDVIVFFPYLYTDENQYEKAKYIERMNNLVSLIGKRKEKLLTVSTGNLILIEETVKLIQSITNYQKTTHTKEKLKPTILDVKGTMLKNSVTQTVYYNYLGLYYNAKANSVLRNKYSLTPHLDFFSLDGLREVKAAISRLSDEDRELYTLYLQEAKEAFHAALQSGNNDVMWEGFIKFNEARSTYFLQQVLHDPQQFDWVSLLNEAINARNRFYILISDILEDAKDSHLKSAFEFEFIYANLLKMNLLIVENMDITDTFNRLKYQAPDYQGLHEDALIKNTYEGKFAKVKDYQNKLKGI